MRLEMMAAEAARIIDPKTRGEALAKYGADCRLREAATEEACAVLVRVYELQSRRVAQVEGMIVDLMKPWMGYTLERLKEELSPEELNISPSPVNISLRAEEGPVKGPDRPMKEWDLEDFQEDPLKALEKVRAAAEELEQTAAERDALLKAVYKAWGGEDGT